MSFPNKPAAQPAPAKPNRPADTPAEPARPAKPASKPPAARAATPDRVLSIDALRGFDMFWIVGGQGVVMALVMLFFTGKPDSPILASIKAQMNHVPWEGFVAWDLIMPLFLFIVGAAMPFSFGKRLERGDGKGAIYRKVLLRTVILFVLGMAAQGRLLEFKLDRLHIFCNTLQAIAAGYLIASVALIHLGTIGQALVTAGLLGGFWAIMRYIPMPGETAGLLEPQRNIALYVDKWVLGQFQDGTTYTWIVSSLSFGATVLLGVLAGQTLRSQLGALAKTSILLAAGGACLGLGWYWGQYFPIIKHLFTSSMVLWAAGWSFLLLALFYLVIDVWGLRRWATFFVVIGANAILAYMVTHAIPMSAWKGFTDPLLAGLAAHLTFFGIDFGTALRQIAPFALLWCVLYYLYRKGTLLRV